MKAYLEAGEFVTTHGVQGELKLYPWTDDAAFACRLPRLFFAADGGKCVRVLSARVHKNMALLTLEGVSSVEDARRYIGRVAWFAREDAPLPAGRHFVQDVIGCTVLDADTGAVYGKVDNITRPAAHEVYTVKNSRGKTFLFPAVPEFLISVEPEKGEVRVRPIPGIFDEAEDVDAEAQQLQQEAPDAN